MQKLLIQPHGLKMLYIEIGVKGWDNLAPEGANVVIYFIV